MSEKVENPQDHGHPDYNVGAWLGVWAFVLSVLASVVVITASCDTQKRLQDLEEGYCQLVPDDEDECKVVPR